MIAAALSRTRLLFVLVVLVTLVGLMSWMTMPRAEDPAFAQRFATVLVPFPGASAPDIERLVVEPVESELQGVAELREVVSTARPGIGIFRVRLKESVGYEQTEGVWDEVRRGLDRVEATLPSDAYPPVFDNDVGDPASAVFLVTGTSDLLALRAEARRLEDRLERVPGVQRIERLGDPGRRIRVELDPLLARRVGLQAPALAAQIRAYNVTVPAGSVRIDGRNLVLRAMGELTSLASVRDLPILVPGGTTLPLGSLANVEEVPWTPMTSRVLRDEAASVGISVIPVPEQDLVALGGRLRAAMAEVNTELDVEIFTFQPDMVRDRIAELTGSLVLGVLIVAGVLMVLMGPRMGLVVSGIVPLVALASIGVYAVGGGILHQISIAALVLALGLLVDNAIVVAEAVQHHLDAGHDNPALAAVEELGVPLGTATGTTVAAFVPMLLSEGGTGDFTRTIPLVVILALVLSYVYALLITPNLAAWALRPSVARSTRLDGFATTLARVATRRPRTILMALGAAVGLAALMAAWVPQSFFPLSDREQIVLNIALPEGTHPDETLAVTSAVSGALANEPHVTHRTAFVGGGLPRFYYNLNDNPSSPHRSVLVVDAPGADLDVLMDRVREIRSSWPEATIVPTRLQQGPPVGAPVQVRLRSDDPLALAEAAEHVTRVMRGIAATRDVENDLGTGLPSLELRSRDLWTLRNGVGRAAVPLATLAQTRGLPAGEVRLGEDTPPIELVATGGESTPLSAVQTVAVATPSGLVPLSQMAETTPRWQPASINRRFGQREVIVSAELATGASFVDVVSELDDRLGDLPEGVTRSFGGAAEGSGEANSALLRTLPLGLGLLVFFLLLEFDSLRRLGIVLTTVPLAAVGVIPGLAISGQPFGFMSLLGLLALVGIVVNNAIVLLNVVERRREEGATVEVALTDAVRLRLRPILLTTVTTVAGMLPLAFSASALWPPLAWALLSGLIASTVLTLVAVPALYAWLFGESSGPRWTRWLGLGLLLPSVATAGEMDLEAFLRAAQQSPSVQATRADAQALRMEGTAAWLDVLTPTVGAEVATSQLGEEVAIDTPVGAFVQQPKNQTTVGVRVTQPVLAPAGWAAATARSRSGVAATLGAKRQVEGTVHQLGLAYLDLVELGLRHEALTVREAALVQIGEDARAAADAGLVLISDVQRAEVALADVRLGLQQLEVGEAALAEQLTAVVGLEEPLVARMSAGEIERSERPDLEAADWERRAHAAGRTASALSVLPTVSAFAGWQGTDNDSLVNQSWTEIGLTLQWRANVGRWADTRASHQRSVAAGQRHRERVRVVQAEQQAALRNLAFRDQAVRVREASVDLAEEAARVVRDRYAENLVSVVDVLQAEAEVAAQREALAVAEVDLQRARLDVAFSGA